MDMLEIIEKKKNKEPLTKSEIEYWIRGYCEGSIPDYQVSSLLMAITLNGMTSEETMALTDAMLHSGKTINLSKISGIKCDKHSTGGVGDKTTLVLCPLVASLGVKIAKMSGRGLGFTGGTLDKLESIPGFRTELSTEEFIDTVNKVGMSVVSQTSDLVVADKKLYALRDVTGTVDSIPLIASSIMSKKLASGSDCILLDVKYGNGAFMQTKERAIELAKTMILIGAHFNKDVKAEITSMEQPLGRAIGNILEVEEAIATLKGDGPQDLIDLCLSSGATMLLQAKVFKNKEEAKNRLRENLSDGRAFEVFRQFVAAQDGDISYIDDSSKFPTALYKHEVRSIKSGYISGIDAHDLGLTSMKLGAGRETLDDLIDPTAGIVLNKKVGDKVAKDELLFTIYTERPNVTSLLTRALNDFDFSDEPVKPGKVVEAQISYDKKRNHFTII